MSTKITEINLWHDSAISSKLRIYHRLGGQPRPALLIIPGGGYSNVCDSTEGVPIARRFQELGYQVFVLLYRVHPNLYPAPQLDAFRAIRLIRYHAQEWLAKPDELAVLGFSAGGHLACSCGLLYNDIDATDGDGADAMSQRPDAMILCYPVITSGPKAHQGSFQQLLGEHLEELRDTLSLEKRVTENTPPAFLWHTATDGAVPYENSLMFAQAMWSKQRSCALHIYPSGSHGMSLGYRRDDIAAWQDAARDFCRIEAGFHFSDTTPRRKVILTFDDAVKNHLTFVAPLLKRYGFGATFFPCRFPASWRLEHGQYLLTGQELKRLHDMGFEIGNHTWNHGNMRLANEQTAAYEIDELTAFLRENGIPAPVSFAYPGGPYAGNIVQALSDRGFRYARTADSGAWEIKKDDPMRLPAFAISQNDRVGFYSALRHCTSDNAVILVFHGVPDIVHPWVNNDQEIFTEFMDYLRDEHFTVLSLRDGEN